MLYTDKEVGRQAGKQVDIPYHTHTRTHMHTSICKYLIYAFVREKKIAEKKPLSIIHAPATRRHAVQFAHKSKRDLQTLKIREKCARIRTYVCLRNNVSNKLEIQLFLISTSVLPRSAAPSLPISFHFNFFFFFFYGFAPSILFSYAHTIAEW